MEQLLQPHVFTFLRTTDKRVSITYTARDSLQPEAKRIVETEVELSEFVLEGKDGDSEAAVQHDDEHEDNVSNDSNGSNASNTTEDHGNNASNHSGPTRRMVANHNNDDASEEDLYDLEDGEDVASISMEKVGKERKLSDPDRRRNAGNSWNRQDTARRRVNPASYRRRNVPPPPASSPRRRYRDVEDNRWVNRNGEAYGYTSDIQMTNSYPGGYTTESYGYSGKGAYESSSGATMLMSGCRCCQCSRYRSYGLGHDYGFGRGVCAYGATWTGSCKDCYARHPHHMCHQRMPLPENGNRDDIMLHGFVPVDFVSPLIIRVSKIEGLDFAADRICPPAGWDPETGQIAPENQVNGTVSWTPPENQDIFMTLTHLEEGALHEALVRDTTSTTITTSTTVTTTPTTTTTTTTTTTNRTMAEVNHAADTTFPVAVVILFISTHLL
eukprot:gnl/TRDRNA2_/TRDRNA2_169716_c0_seq2.p1 gnl/TRDRNA2_/TRDRNA2_169716_c0~~gnl/TRDRNA2_/TRDRNA2_169716_c0_seq2.p1  ORF type:complete len:511 (-),score=61.91 gnl/TRDRNA2_/TRDRNA2_169716_c0_seq2:215-1537(-)